MQIGFTGLLTILFITLKLIHEIDWSWWWVLSPIWVGIAMTGIGLLGAFIFALWETRNER